VKFFEIGGRIKERNHGRWVQWLKAAFIMAGGAVIYVFIFGLLMGRTNPGRYTAKEISDVYTVVESSGGTYYGGVQDFTYVGKGTFQFLDGATYIGEFAKSKRNGSGTYSWPNGDKFTGTWADDQMFQGTYTFADGRVYDGTFQNGHLVDGMIHLNQAAAKYNFSFYDAKVEGGQVTSISCQTTDGLHYNGKLSGYAEVTYPSGNKYHGNMSGGQRDGSGTFTWMSGGAEVAFYTGNWKNDAESGTGEYHYTAQSFPYISGNFVNGKPDGTVKYYESDSKTFTTTWKDGVCTESK